ncbi:MAG TPA: hypothetical protein VN613_11260 [Gemmatimonadaceae bacterium]|nr:hypothetical protein [Gemmatimonadaceae bacterium]
MSTFKLGLYTPPAVPDVLAQPCTRRDQLAMFADLAALLAAHPTMLVGDAVEIVWQKYTVQWRHPE